MEGLLYLVILLLWVTGRETFWGPNPFYHPADYGFSFLKKLAAALHMGVAVLGDMHGALHAVADRHGAAIVGTFGVTEYCIHDVGLYGVGAGVKWNCGNQIGQGVTCRLHCVLDLKDTLKDAAEQF